MNIKQVVLSVFVTTNITFGLSLSDIDISSIKSIDKTLGDIDKTLNDYWDKYDIDTLIENSGLDNELLSCLTDGKSLKDLISKPSLTLHIDGICGSLGGSGVAGVTDFFDSPLVKCSGISKPSSVISAEKYLNDFCGKGSSSSTRWVLNPESGTWETSLVTTSGETTSSNYDSITVVGVGTVEDTVTGGFNPSGNENELSEKKYRNGKTTQEILGDNGGIVINNAFANPNGSDATALRENRVKTLLLKEMASKINPDGSTDESNILLPATKLEALKVTNATAEIIGMSITDLNGLTDRIVQEARKKYIEIEADTLDEYYQKEKKAFMDLTKKDEVVSAYIASVKQKTIDGISAKYAIKLFKLKKQKGYIFDPSQSTAMRISKNKDIFIFNSLIQNSIESELKGEEAIEKRKAIQAIDKAIYNAYPLSSIFRPDIAKKEIDALLKAVDTAIK